MSQGPTYSEYSWVNTSAAATRRSRHRARRSRSGAGMGNAPVSPCRSGGWSTWPAGRAAGSSGRPPRRSGRGGCGCSSSSTSPRNRPGPAFHPPCCRGWRGAPPRPSGAGPARGWPSTWAIRTGGAGTSVVDETGESDTTAVGRGRDDILFLAGECAGLLFFRGFAAVANREDSYSGSRAIRRLSSSSVASTSTSRRGIGAHGSTRIF